VLQKGTVRCKNKLSQEQAEFDLRAHLRKTNPNMHHMEFTEVINETQVNSNADILHLAKVMARR
jgi:hypothetical protein